MPPLARFDMKLLMLHGYTQNGDMFQRKLRRLTARIVREFPGATFHWPSAPLKLRIDDIPDLGLRLSTGIEDLDLRAWFDLRDMQNPPSGFLQSLDLLADVLRTQSPFDGVIAFSQGAVVAPFIASLLQGPKRFEAFLAAKSVTSSLMHYPESFRELQHPPLKFVVLCAGRLVQEEYYDWMYEKPRLETPFCLFNGTLDPLVDSSDRAAVPDKLSGDIDLWLLCIREHTTCQPMEAVSRPSYDSCATIHLRTAI